MAPSKKSKNSNRRFANYSESSSQKEDVNWNKSRQRKRKFSNLGSQWSNDELEQFYTAYRKYGRDWKKVAGAVRNRSAEMVEALYNMNKAYLSLPEGTASIVGLIAMMTDHYNILDASDSEPEKIGGSSLSRKTQKRKHAKVQSNGIKDDSSSPSTASKNGSLLNRIRTDGCAVRKRTPRFPVRFSCREDDNGNYVSSFKKPSRKSELDDNIEDMVATTLTEASQKIASLQASQSPFKTEHLNPSSFRDHGRKTGGEAPHFGGSAIRGDSSRSNTGSRDAKNRDYGVDTSSLLDLGVGMVGGKVYSGNANKDVSIKRFDGACSHNEVTDMKTSHSPFLGKRKRNKTQSASDESSLFGALNTLVDACLMMPSSTEESESSAHMQEEKENSDLAGRSGVHVASSKQMDITEVEGATDTPKIETSAPIRSRKGKNLAAFVKVTPERVQQSLPPNKRKCLPLLEAPVAEEKSALTGQHIDKMNSPQELGESTGPAECSSTSDQMRLQNISAVSTAEVLATSDTAPATSQRRRRKKEPVRMTIQKEIKSSRDKPRNQFVLQDETESQKMQSLKDKLSCCLSSLPVRRWCTYEWFYSAIDYPWFFKKEFVQYLNHVGLGHVPRLTRVEWGVIGSSLGKPRRFSERLLKEQREKLKNYRESVRQHYAELHAGIREGLPTDLARPLSVGQRVIAIHPKSREVHGGKVLTVDYDKYKIQFDRIELGVELVKDIDCMPLNPMENIPELLKPQSFGVYNYYLNYTETRAERLNRAPLVLASNERLQVNWSKGDSIGTISQAMGKVDAFNPLQPVYGQPRSGVNMQGREADIQALTELTCALDKKEAMVMELKRLNDEVLENENSGVTSVKDSELFRRQYAMVLLKLKEAGEQVESSLLNLRQRNTYPGISVPPFQKSFATPTNSVGALPSAAATALPKYDQEPECNVVEIVKDSTSMAQHMVDAALKALPLIKNGEDPFDKIGEALDAVRAKYSEQINSGSFRKQQPSASEARDTSDTSPSKLVNDTDENGNPIPSKLISSCVATLLLIQKCTDRQYPPSEVAEILDSAVTDLHPSCPENLSIYRDIQTCMGRIKNQILALVPS